MVEFCLWCRDFAGDILLWLSLGHCSQNSLEPMALPFELFQFHDSNDCYVYWALYDHGLPLGAAVICPAGIFGRSKCGDTPMGTWIVAG